MLALDAKTGIPKWEAPLPEPPQSRIYGCVNLANVVVDKGKVYVITYIYALEDMYNWFYRTVLLGFNATTGEKFLEVSASEIFPIRGSIALANGVIFRPSFHCVDAPTSNCATRGNYVYSSELGVQAGTQTWSLPIPLPIGGARFGASEKYLPVVADGRIYFSFGRMLYAFGLP